MKVYAEAGQRVNDRREIFAWTMYDWANSAFTTTVVTVLLGPYLTAVATTAAAETGGRLNIFVANINPGSYYPYLISLSILLQIFFLPLLGAIADYTNLRKRLMMIFAYTGAFAVMGFYFLAGDRYLFGGLLFVIANLSFGAAIVFYNAYLLDIASQERRDMVSSRGYALGYLGGGILLLLNLVLVQGASSFGLTTAMAVRISLASAGVWWAIFALIPLFGLKKRRPARPLPPGESAVKVGFKQLWRTLQEMRHYPATLSFLLAYLIYNDGIQTVIGLASQYGAEELGLGQSVLIQTILLVQFFAFGGALAFGLIARRIGAKKSVMISLVIWTVVVIFAYGPLGRDLVVRLPGGLNPQTVFTKDIPEIDPEEIEATSEELARLQARREAALAASQRVVDSNDLVIPQAPPVAGFMGLGILIATVLGSSQALSRSLFSQMIPSGRESEFFGFYEISERGTSWLGPLIFGLALNFTGSYRVAILSLIVFFILGLFLLSRVNVRRAIIDSGNDPTGVVI